VKRPGVTLLVREADTDRPSRELSEDGAVVTGWGGRIECASALGHRLRSGDTPRTLGVACADARLIEAARKEGFPCSAESETGMEARRGVFPGVFSAPGRGLSAPPAPGSESMTKGAPPLHNK
jgi:hypothetical protein